MLRFTNRLNTSHIALTEFTEPQENIINFINFPAKA